MPSTKNHASRRTFTAAASLLWLCAAVQAVGCSSGSDDAPPPPPKTTYTGTIYMASQGGGHVAVVPVTIDPSNQAAPIAVGNISRIQLSSGTGAGNKTHIFHDVRLDGTKLYYSSIFSDTDANPGMVHLGYVDLASNNAVHDAMIDATAEAVSPMMAYCGSGQSATHFFPMTMSSPAYIDAIPKSAIQSGATLSSTGSVTRTFVEDFRTGGDPNYRFAHGVNSPDGNKLFVAVNETSSGSMSGAVSVYVMNASDAVAGTLDPSKVTKNTISGLTAGGGTIAFRSTYIPNGTQILQAGKNRLLVLNAADLSVADNNTAIGGSFAAFTDHGGIENHDVMPTPDGKYAILSLRYQHSATAFQDSGLQLYDLANKKTIGDPVSTCSGCHSSATAAHLTCGIDGKLTAVTQ